MHTYIPTNWINKKTQLNADNMNKIELELARLAKESGGITSVLEGPGVQVTPKSDTEVIIGLKSGSSEDNLLVLDPDKGMILTLSMGYDPETRKLVLSSGSGWSNEVEFDIDKALVNGIYDPDTRNIVLELSDGSEVIVDMSKFRENWSIIDTESIHVNTEVDESGLTVFSFDAIISEEEDNILTIKDDGLYVDGLDWTNMGVSDETDGRWEFKGSMGSKYWHFESGRNLTVDKYVLEKKKYSLDYYKFGVNISGESGNVLELRNGLYVSENIPGEVAIAQEIIRLNEELNAYRNAVFKTTKSLRFNQTIDESGSRIMTQEVRVSPLEGNKLTIDETGVYVPAYEPSGDEPDVTPYLRRLEELEVETPRVKREVNFISETKYE